MDERMKEMLVKSTAHAVGVEMAGKGGERATVGTVDLTAVEQILTGWGETPRKVARKTIGKYGPPNEATPSRLVWFDNGPWKRTLAHDIATGKRDAEGARREYAEQATAFMLKREAPYTERLLFSVARGGTADLDTPKMGPMMKEMMSGSDKAGSELSPREMR